MSNFRLNDILFHPGHSNLLFRAIEILPERATGQWLVEVLDINEKVLPSSAYSKPLPTVEPPKNHGAYYVLFEDECTLVKRYSPITYSEFMGE